MFKYGQVNLPEAELDRSRAVLLLLGFALRHCAGHHGRHVGVLWNVEALQQLRHPCAVEQHNVCCRSI
jgi:hypothetical protein